MLNFEKMKIILEEIEEKDLFNQFIINLLDYNSLNIKNIIVRYKIEDCLIIDIFDYNIDKKFIRYYFGDNEKYIEKEENNVIIKVINIKNYYNNYNKFNKYYLFSSLFYEKDIITIENNLSNLFNNEIKNIIMKHL